MADPQAIRARFRGIVQGVGFRAHVQHYCRAAQITGWVRNRMDGSVEAVVQGSPGAVDAIVAWAHRGPEAADVRDLEVSEAEGDFRAFEKRPTG